MSGSPDGAFDDDLTRTDDQWRAVTTRRRRWVEAFLLLALAQVVLILLQSASAGHLLVGNRSFQPMHEVIGANVIGFVSIAQIIVAVVCARGGWVRWSLVVVAVVTFALVVAQVYLGFATRLALHVPIAVLILVAQCAMAAMAVVATRRRRPTT